MGMETRPAINTKGRLIDFDTPRVMGIINITPDSFYSGSRYADEKSVLEAAGRMVEEGADFIDIGGCSTRPGAAEISIDEESGRVIPAVRLISSRFPGAIISVDTFRSAVAREACENGAHMINDISGGEADEAMFPLIGELNVPYVLMHMQGTPLTMQKNPQYDDIIADILQWYGKRIVALHALGVNDIILDPGFGFGKTIAGNFELLRRLDELTVAGLPLMVGLSRKSMIWKSLGITPGEALTGTTVLNTAALLKGASVLRVHDVREAKEAVKLISLARKKNSET